MKDNRNFLSDLKDLVGFHVEHNSLTSKDFKYASALGELFLQFHQGKYEDITNEINEVIRNELNRRIKDAVNDKLRSQALLNDLKDRTE